VAVSAYGREQPLAVGFGDDVAAAAGLVVDDGDGPYPVGDAIADPLAGVTAAAAVSAALRGSRGCLLDVSMRDVAAHAGGLVTDEAQVVQRDGAWWVDCQGELIPVREPRARHRVTQAPAMGAHTSRVLAELRGMQSGRLPS
jgi:crotonobetainyl-CoA:carnitine CoA-transferase CaiB-like acyl-CoA transferase